MQLEEKLKQLADTNEQILALKSKYQNNDAYSHVSGKFNSIYEIGFNEHLSYLSDFFKPLLQTSDLSGVKSSEDFFELLKLKASEYEEKRSLDFSELKQLSISKNLLISEIKKIIPEPENFFVFNLNSIPNVRIHKIYESINALKEDFPNKFKFESIQNMTSDFNQNNVITVFQGDLDELKTEIRNSKNPKISYMKSIVNSKFETFFSNPTEHNIFIKNNKIVKLNELDNESIDLILPKKERKIKNRM